MEMKDINYHGDVVVFDLDDTLMGERDYCRDGFKLIERTLTGRFGPEWIGVARRMDSLLRRRENYFKLLEELLQQRLGSGLSDAGIKDLMKELVGIYRVNPKAGIKMRPFMEDILGKLSSQGCVIGIITDGRSLTQRAKIDALQLSRFIAPANILISEETGHDKHDPENFRVFVNRYPEARRFIYIADNERKDFRIPNLMGWLTVKISVHYDNVHENLLSADILQAPAIRLISNSQLSDILQLNSITN